ncbi:MAG: PKD domain-containing protein [Nanoarchaeota archaeon]|nr:PKD domain-containing protein [Nanoarchaeota archaeon]
MIKGDSFTLKDGSIIIVSAFGQEQVRFTLELRAPDLIVESITISPTTPIAGQSATITSTIKNIGNSDAVNYILDIQHGDETDFLEFQGITLTPDQSTEKKTTHTYVKSGSYTIKVKASSFQDLNKNNDELAKSIFVGTQESGVKEQNFFGSTIHLVHGWNLISVTEPMIGKSIEQISNVRTIPEFRRCESRRTWIFFNGNWVKIKSWLSVEPADGTERVKYSFYDEERFKPEHLGLGMWLLIETRNGCTLGCGLKECTEGVS